MVSDSATAFPIIKVTSPRNGDKAADFGETEDMLAVEEPLEIRIVYGPVNDRQQKNISVTMCTPGNDAELATGFLFTEGIINRKEHIIQCVSLKESGENIVIAELQPGISFDHKKIERHFYTSSSCGVCGKSSISAVKSVLTNARLKDNLKINVSIFTKLPEALRKQQEIFEQTGGLHASALFDISGNLLLTREDVGRHNALDKLIGASLVAGNIPLINHILLLSGRASFELIQKAVIAGIKIVCAVGAPSSLAVELANECDMTLIGFLRDGRFNIYTGKQRILK